MKLWKVLIADDELIIREGIKESINWKEFNMDPIGEAEDGEEAVELALIHSIDILLIDINMPIKNGIEAMKEIREKLPNCKIVVISGYDDFQYAQEAIKINVEEYLLKPIHPKKLEEIVGKISGDLEQDKRDENYIEQVNKLMENNNSRFRESFLQDWLHSDIEEEEIKNQLEAFSYPVRVPYSIAIFHLQSENAPFGGQTHEMEKLYTFLKKDINQLDAVVYMEDYKWLTIINWGEEDSFQFFLSMQNLIQEKTGKNVLGKYGRTDTFSINNLYQELRVELNKLTNISPLAKKTLEYIRGNYTDKNLSLNEIAQQLHVTSVYLSRIIKKELGFSYVQIITSLRVKAAKHYLKTSHQSVKEIAEKCGYDSQHYFSSAFKKSVNMSPKQYRDYIKGNDI